MKKKNPAAGFPGRDQGYRITAAKRKPGAGFMRQEPCLNAVRVPFFQ